MPLLLPGHCCTLILGALPFSNLYDRMVARPLMAIVEKKWVVFQLLIALSRAHRSGCCHGDLKVCAHASHVRWIHIIPPRRNKPRR